MQSLLDKFTPAATTLRPKTRTELFALQLAQKLGDAMAANHYVALADSYSESQLLCAYRRTLRDGSVGDRGRRFQEEMKRVRANGYSDRRDSLISLRVERRTIAAAIFQGDHLEYTDARQLSSAHDKALASALGFIDWLLARFSAESAALESIPNSHEFQRRVLHDAICHSLRERGLPIWEIPKIALLEGCGHPPLKFRAQLRQVATAIWPILEDTRSKTFIQDAAILGLHVQVERLFIIG